MKNKSIALLYGALTVVLAAGCATQSPDGPPRAPQVTLEQVGSVMEMGVSPSGGIPMQYVLKIQNPFDHEVKLRSVEIGTIGDAGGYSMKQVRHNFDETIPALSTREIRFRAWVRVLIESEMRSVDHPVLLRGIARFESPSGPMSRNFSARVNQTSKVSSGS